jgi:ketosteroid isomerase-like protein
MGQLEHFKELYRTMSADNLDGLGEVYAKDICFVDPAHEINGLEQLHRYFQALYQNISTINFDFNHVQYVGDEAFVLWSMTYSHPRLNRNKPVTVPGATHLRMEPGGKIVYHRDYFDLGAMLYEQLPVLGKIIKTIRRKLGT